MVYFTLLESSECLEEEHVDIIEFDSGSLLVIELVRDDFFVMELLNGFGLLVRRFLPNNMPSDDDWPSEEPWELMTA